MTASKEIYNLKNDKTSIKRIQAASLDKDSSSGLQIENGLLYGTPDWFLAIEAGQISTKKIIGVISKVYMSGHNDYPEFEIDSNGVKTSWTREGNDEEYVVGRKVELVYAIQKFKRPIAILGPVSKCVIKISILTD